MVENNPHKVSTMGTGSSLAAITDASDFPHSGLIKGLSQMARQNLVVRNNSNDFDITQASSGNVVQVSAGSYLRDGKLYTASAANFTIGTTSNDTSLLAQSQFDKGYHLLVINASNAIKMRQPTVANKVPDYTVGDTIIAVIEISSTTSDGSRNVQFLTTDKAANSLSIAYDNSNVYTEALSIESSASGDVTIESKVSDKDIIIKANDGGASTEIMRVDSSSASVGIGATAPTSKLEVSGDTTISRSADSGQTRTLIVEGARNATGTDYARLDFKNYDSHGPTSYAGARISALNELTGVNDGTLTFSTNNANAGLAEAMRITDDRKVAIGTATVDANSLLAVEGSISLDEISAPTSTGNRAQLYANADNELHMVDGAGVDTIFLKSGKHSIWVPSSAMTPLTTNGCSALTQVEMTAGRPELQVLDFAADADDHAQFTVAFPKSWNEGTVTFQPFWTVTGTNTGTAVWNLTGISVDDNYAINSGYPSIAATGAKAHSGTSNDLNVSAESGALTITNASVDSVTYFKLSLDTSSSSQTGTVRLIGLKMFYDINAGNDE